MQLLALGQKSKDKKKEQKEEKIVDQFGNKRQK